MVEDFKVFNDRRFGPNMQKKLWRFAMLSNKRAPDKTIEEVLREIESGVAVRSSFVSAIDLADKMINATRYSSITPKDADEEQIAGIVLQMVADKNRRNR